MILETKLNLPQPKAGTLLRKNLIELIKNNLDKKLILICADAGYGKTTLLGQLVKAARLPAVFYDLDKGDSDLMTFYSYLVNGIKQIDPSPVKCSEELLKHGSESGNSVELLFGALINELYHKRKEELFIILDNYHNLTDDSAVHRAIDFFIDRLPEKIHVIISSRSVPPLVSMSRWRAKQDLFELTRKELMFTRPEIAELLNNYYQTVLSEKDLRQMASRTEGWITGIRLIMQTAGKDETAIRENLQKQAEANQPLFEYFANDVLFMESPGMQVFLTKCSILNVMTPGACDAILGADSSGQVLKKLEKQHMFISLVGDGEYKYHHLFRETLLKKMSEGQEEKILHAKAAAYYEEKGMLEQAIGHLLHAGNWAKASAHIITMAAEMEQNCKFTILIDWLRQLPEEFLKRKPELLTHQGIIHRLQGRLDDAEAAYATAEQALRMQKNKGSRRIKDPVALSSVLQARGRIVALSGRQEKAIAILQQALRICPDTEPNLKIDILNPLGLSYQTTGDFKRAKSCLEKALRLGKNRLDDDDLIAVKANLAAQHLIQGNIYQAVDQYKSLKSMHGNKYFNGIGMLWSNASSAALLLGDADWAAMCLEKSRGICALHDGDAPSQAALCFSFGMLSLQRGEWDQAVRDLEAARRQFTDLGRKIGAAKCLIGLGCLYRYRKDILKAREHLNAAVALIDKSDAIDSLQLHIEEALLDIDCGHIDRAASAIRSALIKSRTIKCRREEFTAQLARASLLLSLGRERPAVRIMAQAVKISRAQGYAGILIRELRHNQALAELTFKLRRRDEYLTSLKPEIQPETERAPEGIDFMARLFGSVQMFVPQGRELPLKWPSRKEASLFAYLLLHRDRMCNIEELVKVFWPNAPLKRAEQDIYNMIYQMKKTLGNAFRAAGMPASRLRTVIAREGRGYRLSPDFAYWVDTEEFYRTYKRARLLEQEGNKTETRQCLQKCIELYRDSFLCNLGEFWVEERRDEYEKIFLLAAQKLADYCAVSGDHAEAERLLRACLDKDPHFEENHVKLWQALKAQGRTGDIHKDYMDLKKAMKKHLGETPCEGTDKIYRELTAAGESGENIQT